MIETEFKYFYKYLLECLGWQKNGLTGDTKYMFIHIPKTAGTSFLFSLYDHFPYQNIFPHFKDYIKPNGPRYVNTKRFAERKDAILKRNIKIIAGHLHYAMKDEIALKNVKTLVFFREPLARVLSDLIYLNSTPKTDFSGLSFESLLSYNNHQIYRKQAMLMGYDYENIKMAQALANLENCDFVGITEQYEKSIRLCNAIFGWSLNPKLSKNQTKNIQTADKKDLLKKIDQKLLKPDQIIYDAALIKFEQLCKDYDID